MTAAAWILFAFCLARLGVAVANLMARLYLPTPRNGGGADREVSVLIPARNEERNIGRLLADLTADSGGICEILVYDDRSDDRTAEIVQDWARKNPLIRLIAGRELPAGWQGKNHACYLLARQAAGRRLLFLDADVRIRRQAVERAAGCMRQTGAALLSVFPEQLMPGRGTRLAVPLMNWILLSLLPLSAVRRMPQASLCAANGQFLLFDGAVYRARQPHLACRTAAVEDMAIARSFKRGGLPVAVLLGRGDVACTMYRTLREASDGLSRSIFGFFGGSEILCWLFTAATTAGPVLAFAALGPLAGAIYLAAAALMRAAVSAASRQSVAANLLLALPQQAVLWYIVGTASVRKRKKRLLWKGRNIFIQG